MTENQSFKSRGGDVPDIDSPPPLPPSAAGQDFSSVLDEIDDILEENVVEFVRGFVQEGGQ
ncbi:ubiquitin-like protein Pup [Flaviflexus huanghaiensis]|uniref:ubiquitin-like protein Pup n=1 Tax=Flaviflexus huanghaiensis TaxID=1111473 RepID=UPI0015F8EB88|nr:ubiquitin-like protein Pup [Flaviflexus huanghaiensis]